MPYDASNVFARILRGEIPCDKVYEDDYALAFHDIRPLAPVHVLVVRGSDGVHIAEPEPTLLELDGVARQVLAEDVGVDPASYLEAVEVVAP